MIDKNTKEKINKAKDIIRTHRFKRRFSKERYRQLLNSFCGEGLKNSEDKRIEFSGKDAFIYFTYNGDDIEMGPYRLFPNFVERISEKINDLQMKYEDPDIRYRDGTITGFFIEKIINPPRRVIQYLEDLQDDRTMTGSKYQVEQFNKDMRVHPDYMFNEKTGFWDYCGNEIEDCGLDDGLI